MDRFLQMFLRMFMRQGVNFIFRQGMTWMRGRGPGGAETPQQRPHQMDPATQKKLRNINRIGR